TRSLLHQDMEGWARQYGPMFRVRLARQEVLVVSDHELIHTVLRARPDLFHRPTQTTLVAEEMKVPMGVFGAEGDSWRAQRRMVMASFSPAHVRAYLPLMRRVALRLDKRWRAAAQQQAPIDLVADLMLFTVDTITGLAFGAEVNTLEAQGDVIQEHLNDIFPALFHRTLALLPLWRLVKLPRDRRLDRSVALVREAIDGFIAQARKRLQNDPTRRAAPPNLLEAMIVAADEPDSGVADADVASNVMAMLLAGEDTTANTVAWAIYLLKAHPDMLERVQQEVLNGVPDFAAVTVEQIDGLPFLDACLQETMRLKPVAPFIPMQATQDTVVGDVMVPKGAIVWSVLRGESVSERFFESPDAGNPPRWLQAHCARNASAKRIAMPFGAGPRMCPGRYLALVEMKLCLAMLLSSFDILSVRTAGGGPAQE